MSAAQSCGALRPTAVGSPPRATSLAADLRRGALDAENLLDRDCALVYAATESCVETAARLGLVRRTVRARVGRGQGLMF